MYIIYNIFYNTTSKYINPDTWLVQWKKLVHQLIVHNFLLKNYYKESLITSHCRISFPSLTQPINLEYEFIRATK